MIALTAPASPLAQLADWLIPIIAIETDFIYKPSSSRYAMMMALDLLVTELAVKQGETSRELAAPHETRARCASAAAASVNRWETDYHGIRK